MMTPIYMNPPPTNSFPLFELKEDDNQHFKLFMTPHQTASSCPIFCGTSEDQRGIINNPSDQSQHHEHKVYKHIWHEESSDRQALPSSSTPPMMDDSRSGLNLSATKGENGGEENKSDNGSVIWMSSKMRLMRKMMNSNCETTDKAARIVQQKYHIDHHKQQHGFTGEINSSENFNITVRICSNCNTTKTPLWRSGPRGPKSLCNACGIRQRKARRAMEAAAAAAANGGVLIDTKADTSSSSSSTKTNYKVINKDKKSRSGYNLAQYKKQCEQLQDSPNDHQRKKKLCFEDFALNLLSKNSSFRRVFPQDEEEGAILLMALSCGLV